MTRLTRRGALAALTAAPFACAADAPVFEPHVHLFSADLATFPKHPNSPAALTPAPLEEYLPLAKREGIRHAIHVSAEPYQDDTRYLEYTLEHAPSGFLKGIVLLDTLKPDTPARLESLARKYPGRLLGMRIHCVRNSNEPPTTTGTIRNRDLFAPQARLAWKKAADLGLWVQPHIMPWFAPDIAKLAREYSSAHVIVDHFGHAGVNGKETYGYRNPRDFEQVAALAKVPNVVLKVSGLQYSSREPFPHKDLGPLVRRAYDSFGPDRLVWGSFGTKPESFATCEGIWKEHFGFLSAADRRKIRFENGRRLFGF